MCGSTRTRVGRTADVIVRLVRPLPFLSSLPSSLPPFALAPTPVTRRPLQMLKHAIWPRASVSCGAGKGAFAPFPRCMPLRKRDVAIFLRSPSTSTRTSSVHRDATARALPVRAHFVVRRGRGLNDEEMRRRPLPAASLSSAGSLREGDARAQIRRLPHAGRDACVRSCRRRARARTSAVLLRLAMQVSASNGTFRAVLDPDDAHKLLACLHSASAVLQRASLERLVIIASTNPHLQPALSARGRRRTIDVVAEECGAQGTQKRCAVLFCSM